LKLYSQKMNSMLKRIVAVLLSFLMLLPICFAVSYIGSCYTANISAEREIRAGYSFQVRLILDSAATGYEGYFTYDTSVLTLTRIVPVNNDLYQDFQVQTETGYVRVTHSTLVRQMLSLTFYVNENAKTNTEAMLRFYSGTVINENGTENIADSSFRFLIVDRESSDATLRSLDISVYHSAEARDQELEGFYATLIPSFSASHTTYSVTVANEFTHYLIHPVLNDSTAKVTSSLKGELTEGIVNTVEVSVTAEDGTKKNYTLQIFRERAPEISSEPSEPSIDVSSEDSSELESEEPSDVSEEQSWIESSADESEEISSESEQSEESSEVEETLSAESSGETSLVSKEPPSASGTSEHASSDAGSAIDFQNLTGIFICVAAVSVLAIAVLVIRILYLVHKKRR